MKLMKNSCFLQRYIRKDPNYLKDWKDLKRGENMGPCTLSFAVIHQMNSFLMTHGLFPDKINLPRKADFSCFTMTESIAFSNAFGRYLIKRFMRVQKCDPKYIELFQFVLQTCSLLLHWYFDMSSLKNLKYRVGAMLGMLCILLPHCWSANSIHHTTGHLPDHPRTHGGIMLVGMQMFEAFGGNMKRWFAGCTKDTIASIMMRLHQMFALQSRKDAEKEEAAAAAGRPASPAPDIKARCT